MRKRTTVYTWLLVFSLFVFWACGVVLGFSVGKAHADTCTGWSGAFFNYSNCGGQVCQGVSFGLDSELHRPLLPPPRLRWHHEAVQDPERGAGDGARGPRAVRARTPGHSLKGRSISPVWLVTACRHGQQPRTFTSLEERGLIVRMISSRWSGRPSGSRCRGPSPVSSARYRLRPTTRLDPAGVPTWRWSVRYVDDDDSGAPPPAVETRPVARKGMPATTATGALRWKRYRRCFMLIDGEPWMEDLPRVSVGSAVSTEHTVHYGGRRPSRWRWSAPAAGGGTATTVR
jgi:hypothetical protein